MKISFNTIFRLWKEIHIQAGLMINEQEFSKAMTQENKIAFDAYYSFSSAYLKNVSGDFVTFIKPVKKDIEQCFLLSLLGLKNLDSLNNKIRDEIRRIHKVTFGLGVLNHLAYVKHPHRTKIKSLFNDDDPRVRFSKYKETGEFFVDWVNSKYRKEAKEFYYKVNKKLNSQPDKMFEYFYNNNLKPSLTKIIKIPFLKKKKFEESYKNLFLSGALLVLIAEKELSSL